jgi:hypothetical protein
MGTALAATGHVLRLTRALTVIVLIVTPAACFDLGADLEIEEFESSPQALSGPTPTGDGEVVASRNAKVRLLIGYDPTFDGTHTRCVESGKDVAATKVVADNFAASMELLHVVSRNQLADELGLDLDLGIRYKVASADGTLNLVNSFSQSRNAVNMLLKVTAEYTAIVDASASNLQLSSDAVTRLKAGAARFQRSCGATFVQGVVYGARYYQLVIYEAADEETASKLRATLGVRAGVAETFSVHAGTKFRLGKRFAGASVKMLIRSTHFGFAAPRQTDSTARDPANRRTVGVPARALLPPSTPDKSLNAAGSNPVDPSTRTPQVPNADGATTTNADGTTTTNADGTTTPTTTTETRTPSSPDDAGTSTAVTPSGDEGTQTPFDEHSTEPKRIADQSLQVDAFVAIDDLRQKMEDSVLQDMCHDGGGSRDCGDGPGPGYFANPRHTAAVVGVIPGAYRLLPNAEATGTDPLEVIGDRHQQVMDFISAYSSLKERMEAVYRAELEPFLSSQEEVQALYNVAPPGKPLRTREELVALANQWAKRLRPAGHESGTGTDIIRIEKLIRECWNKAAKDFAHSCWNGENPRKASDWIALDQLLKTWRDTARLVRLRVAVAARAVAGPDAAGACRELNSEENAYELPIRSVLPWLEPAIATGPVPWHETWYAIPADKLIDARNRLSPDPTRLLYPHVASYPGDAQMSFFWADKARMLHPLCVNTSGLFPSLPDPSQELLESG